MDKKNILDTINALASKLTEDESQHLYLYIKDILKLPRTTKTLSNEVIIYLQPYITIIDKDDEDSKFENKLINELHIKYKKIIKEYFENNNTVISDLLNIENNLLTITDDDVDGVLKLNYYGNMDGNYYIIQLNKSEFNNIEKEYYITEYNKIHELVDSYNKSNTSEQLNIYKELYDIIIPILEDNNLKIPKELKHIEKNPVKIQSAINKINEYNIDSFDIRFRRIELYSMKDILEENEDKITTFEHNNLIFNLTFVLKKIS